MTDGWRVLPLDSLLNKETPTDKQEWKEKRKRKNKHTKKIERWNTKNPTGKEEKQTNKVGKKEGKKENISLE